MRGASAGTLRRVLQFWTKRFQSHQIPDPNSSAEFIIAQVLGKKTLFDVKPDLPLTEAQRHQVRTLSRMRLTRMPVQYVLEEWDFRDLTLKMKPPVLIPRPETEELVELCMDSLRSLPILKGQVFLEVGPGSGAVTLSLLKRFPELQAVAVDISQEACQLTRLNAQLTGTSARLKILHGDIAASAVQDLLKSLGPFCLAVSNPPYISTPEMTALQDEIRCFEDPIALHGGEDGLDIIMEVILSCSGLLQSGGHLWLEVGETHPPLVENFTANPDTWKELSTRLMFKNTITDLYGKPRFCQLMAASHSKKDQNIPDS